MSLKPRHFVLIAVIIGIFLFNLYRHRQPRLPTDGTAPIVTSTHTPAQTPAWSSFDHAAALRDSTPTDFDPAMQALHQQLTAATDPTVSDIKGCLTWLEFYRQGTLHPSRDPAWKDRSQHHLDGCVKYHLDTSA
jgi:hypothetical protein